MTSACGTDWALGIEARSRALVSGGAEAERLYRETVERLGFDAMGMEAFAERARRGLLATGETARKRRTAASGPQLTPQESQVARLAGDGLTNPEVGGRLFISTKTVQYHLSKVFTKLGISSRRQLHQALADNGDIRGFPNPYH